MTDDDLYESLRLLKLQLSATSRSLHEERTRADRAEQTVRDLARERDAMRIERNRVVAFLRSSGIEVITLERT